MALTPFAFAQATPKQTANAGHRSAHHAPGMVQINIRASRGYPELPRVLMVHDPEGAGRV